MSVRAAHLIMMGGFLAERTLLLTLAGILAIMILTQPCEGSVPETPSVLQAENDEGVQLVAASYDETEKSTNQEQPGNSVQHEPELPASGTVLKDPNFLYEALELQQKNHLVQDSDSRNIAENPMNLMKVLDTWVDACDGWKPFELENQYEDQKQDRAEVCSNEYRTFSGRCNHNVSKWWGSANQALARWLPAEYEDGKNLPLGWTPGKKHNGFFLPLVREVSNKIVRFPKEHLTDSPFRTLMFVHWWEFIKHDLIFSPESESGVDHTDDKSDGYDHITNPDCDKNCDKKPPCFPIEIPPYDPYFESIGDCLPYTRTKAIYSNTRNQEREQLSLATSFLDASMVYGSDVYTAQRLRNLTNNNGMLAINQHFSDQGRALLPFDNAFLDPCQLTNRSANIPCFLAGDERVSQTLELMALHTLFLREHNRLAKELKLLNPQWDGRKLYNEARKIVGAMIQVITFKEFLPLLLGPKHYGNHFKEYQGYCYKEDPRIANVFTMTSLWSHTMMQPFVPRLDSEYRTSGPTSKVPLNDAAFATWRVVHEGGIDPILRGLQATPAKKNLLYALMVDELLDGLYKKINRVGLDLAANNLQQGRDHGIPGYNAWRRYCGLSEPETHVDLGMILKNPLMARKFMDVYGTPENIDLWVGAIAEPAVEGGHVGPLLACLLGQQFRKIRSADWFWWENPLVFNFYQQQELKKVTLASIICKNTNIDFVSSNIFKPIKYKSYFNCSVFEQPRRKLDLFFWKKQ